MVMRTVGQHPANTPLPPHPQSETGTLATHSGKMYIIQNDNSPCKFKIAGYGYYYSTLIHPVSRIATFIQNLRLANKILGPEWPTIFEPIHHKGQIEKRFKKSAGDP